MYDFVLGQISIHENITYDDLVGDLLSETKSKETYRVKRALDWLLLANLIETNNEGKVRIRE